MNNVRIIPYYSPYMAAEGDFRITSQMPNRTYFAADASADDGKKKIIQGIGKVIANDKPELVKKLDDLGVACSCVMSNAPEKDFSDVIISNLGNENLKSWLSSKMSSKGYVSGNFSNDDGGTTITPAEITSGLNVLGQGLNIWSTSQQTKLEQQKAKDALTLAAINAKLQAQQAASAAAAKKKSSTGMYWAIGGTAAVLMVAGYFYWRSTKRVPIPQQ